MTPKQILQEWRENNQSSPMEWKEICYRMENSPDMDIAWDSLLIDGVTPVHVFSMVTDSVRESGKDVRRLSSCVEQQSIAEVRKHTTALLSALRGAQLLGESAFLGSYRGTPATIAWTDRSTLMLEQHSLSNLLILSLPELLRELELRCNEIINSPATNAIDRQTGGKERSQVRAFIRRLAVQFNHKYGKEMPENLARVACAVFSLENPITGRDVEKILQDSPLRN